MNVRPQLTRLGWGALPALPLIGVEVLLTGAWNRLGSGNGAALITLASMTVIMVITTTVMVWLYDRTLGQHWTPHVPSERRALQWFVAGPIASVLLILAGVPVPVSLVIGLLINGLLLLLTDRRMVWDAVMSAFAASAWYVVLHAVFGIRAAGDTNWLTIGPEPLGLTLLSIPLEHYILVAAVGAFVGPLYAATKRWRHPGPIADGHIVASKIAGVSAVLVLTSMAVAWLVLVYGVAPAVRIVTPEVGLATTPINTRLIVTFSRPIERDNLVLYIQPQIDGTWSFADQRSDRHEFRQATYTFDTTLAPDTRYEATITGVRSLWGMAGRDVTIGFTTAAAADIVSLSMDDPSGLDTSNGSGSVYLPDPCRALNVNLSVPNDGSAEFQFTVEPDLPITTTLSDDRAMYQLRVQPCWPIGTYHLQAERRTVLRDTLTDEVVAATEFLPALDTVLVVGQSVTTSAVSRVLAAVDASATYTPVRSQHILKVPMDFQDKPLSCEAAALKMALAGRGARVSENDIMRLVKYDPTPHRGNIWGDPDSAFVGNIFGRQNTTGYGVHWNPIAQAARRWKTATVLRRATVQDITKHLAAGHPVVIWGTLGRAYRNDWKTPKGKTIRAWKGEHARTVIGYYGTASNPTHFVINDPAAGRIVWSKATFQGNWSAFENSAVAVD